MKAPKLLALCQKCISEYATVQHKTPINLFCDDFLDEHLVHSHQLPLAAGLLAALLPVVVLSASAHG